MSGEVNGEPDAHDQVDHGQRVEVDAPQGHKAQDTQLDGDDGEGHPQGAQRIGYEDQRDDHHDHSCQRHTLDGRRKDHQKLQPKQRWF